ncbi:MAG: glycosyltransferase family 39 protein [Planctomycetes bacterium]|nr:glycosyltransferase family 39 protein [Planctomycetota bacterium]
MKSAWWTRNRGSLPLFAVAALVVVVGVGLRATGLRDRGLMFYDEGVYLGEGRFFAGAVRSVPLALRYGWLRIFGGEPASSARVEELQVRMRAEVVHGLYPWYPKNTHSFMIGLALLTFGDVDWAGHAVSLVFGALSIALVLLLGHSLYGTGGALLAGLVLALCPLHVLLSRRSFAETDSTFFLLGAVALMRPALRTRRFSLRTLFLAGLSTGLCFTCNHRNAIAPAIVWMLYGTSLLDPARPLAGLRFRGLVWLCVGMLLPLLAWETLYLAAFGLLDVRYGSLRTYFGQILFCANVQGAADFGFGDPESLLYLLREYVGWPILLLVALGLAREIRTRRSELLTVAIPLLWVIVFFQLRAREQCLRYLGAASPFLALAAGAALRSPYETWATSPRQRRGRIAAASVGCVGAVLLSAALTSRDWLSDRSGMARVIAWLHERQTARACRGYFCLDGPLAAYYDPPGDGCEFLPSTLAALKARYVSGIRYVVVTPTLLLQHKTEGYFWPLLREVEKASPPVRLEHPAGALAYFAHEHNLFVSSTLAETRATEVVLAARGGTVLIYDLHPYFRR